MKIKINNIFEKINLNKNKINDNKIKNLREIRKEKSDIFEENYNTNKVPLRRRKVLEKKYKFENVFLILKKNLNIKKSYYVIFLLMVGLAGISIYSNFKTYENLNEETYNVFSSEENIVASSTNENYQTEETNNSDARKSEVEISKDVKVVNKPKIIPLSFTSPLSGEIIKKYSDTKVIYSETLESWKTHDGIDIAASIGSTVKACEKGIIEKIYLDSFLGNTIVIDHGQGYKSIYSNLEPNVKVKVKQVVKKSDVIASVGSTAIGEIKDKPHIHFMLMFNNKVIDPASKIKF